MVITVITMRVVQVPIDEVVDMVPMWDRFMPTARTMNVALLMASAAVIRRAGGGVLFCHLELVFIHMVSMHVVEMAVMEIVHMVPMLDGGVAAAWAVHM